jgi:hypothetical protein
MPQVVFEPTIQVFKRANTVHALDRTATVIGYNVIYILIIKSKKCEIDETGFKNAVLGGNIQICVLTSSSCLP